MTRYFRLQAKLLRKRFPFLLFMTALLLFGLLTALVCYLRYDAGRTEKQKFRVGIVQESGEQTPDDGENGMEGALSMGLAMLETIDDTRFSVSLTEMDEETAKELLEKKEIAAYFVFPAGFADAAMAGEMKSIRAVFSRQSGELTLLLKEELTGVVSELLTVSQKGAYGAERAADALGGKVTPYEALNDMVLRYTGLILRRGGTYTVHEMGITPDATTGGDTPQGDTPIGVGLSFAATFVLSFFVFFLLLCALPLAGVYIRRDRSLAGQLSAAGIGAGKQTVCRFAALSLCLLLLLLLLSLLTGAAFAVYAGVENAGKPGDSTDGGLATDGGTAADGGLGTGNDVAAKGGLDTVWEILGGDASGKAALLPLAAKLFCAFLPSAALAAAFSLLLFSLAGDALNGILLHFFTTLTLCYLSGCFYPLSAFPESMQKAALLLPPSVLRGYLASVLRGDPAAVLKNLGGVLLFIVLFLLLTAAVVRRERK